MNDIDLAYAAGIMDGEGSIMLMHNKGKYKSPSVSVSSTSYELLTFLSTTFGGTINSHKVYKSHHKPAWSWRLVNDKAICFLSKVKPYLKEKRKKRRARLILSLYKKLTKRNGKYTVSQISDKLRFEKLFHSF